jgi:hypothetical protein
MNGGVIAGGWTSPEPFLAARGVYQQLLEHRPAGGPPSSGMSVLLTLSPHELLWQTHATAVAMSLSTGAYTSYWLEQAADSSPQVQEYLETFGLPGDGVPFAASVITRAYAPEALIEASALLGGRHAICEQSCTYGGALDTDCYYTCMLG